MLRKLAWLKVVAENRHTIFKLITEAVFGSKERPTNPDAEIPYEEVPATEVQGEASA